MTADTPAPVLAPCPFCGCTTNTVKDQCADVGDGQYAIWCDDCLSEGPLSESEDDAITNWNRRPSDPVLGELVEALRGVRQELWVDYCLGMGRTDTDPRPFNSKPHIRIIDNALNAAQPDSEAGGTNE